MLFHFLFFPNPSYFLYSYPVSLKLFNVHCNSVFPLKPSLTPQHMDSSPFLLHVIRSEI